MFHRNTEKLESLIGSNSRFKGEIETSGTIRVDGTVEGQVAADWIVIGEQGRIKGNISARGIVVGGRVDGDLQAKEIVEIKNKGQVHGEVLTNKLMIAEGAVFEGRSTMQKEESKVVELPIKERAR
ncbi:MAG: polymer-forming cytoskeletal protein [Nitrospiraceae bacterium]|nr:polymer-forming cytoskeletal protein [Nitrospiraceae bacterium]